MLLLGVYCGCCWMLGAILMMIFKGLLTPEDYLAWVFAPIVFPVYFVWSYLSK